MRTSAGVNTEAVYIFHNMVRKFSRVHKPEYMAAVFESEGKTFRDEAFAGLQSNRTETPPGPVAADSADPQNSGSDAHSIVEFPDYEADDVIGALASGRRRRSGRGDRVERQGHAAACRRPRLHVESGEGRHIYCPPRSKTLWA